MEGAPTAPVSMCDAAGDPEPVRARVARSLALLLIVLPLAEGAASGPQHAGPAGAATRNGPSSSQAEPELAAPAQPGDRGFLVVAPDRGFLGNEEVRDAYAPFAAAFRAELAVVPGDGDAARYVLPAIERLRDRGARRVTVLPLFVSGSHPRLEALRRELGIAGPGPGAPGTGGNREDLADAAASRAADATTPGPGPMTGLPTVELASAYGDSWLAQEALVDRLATAGADGNTALLLVASGAGGEADVAAMTADLERLAAGAAQATGVAATRVVVLAPGADTDRLLVEAARRSSGRHGRVVAVAFHLGQRLDSMMDVNRSVASALVGSGVELLPPGPLPHPSAALWMAREANRRVPLAGAEIGYVVMPHGADVVWNESIRQPLRELEARLPVEYAYSMADPVVLERAVRALEARGARGIVVLRVFSMASSFRQRTEYMLGLADDPGATMGMGAPPRIRSTARFVTVGGIEDHPLFARALLERAREISREPARETVLLLGHGSGDEADNDRWLANLESLALRMRNLGAAFAEIRWANWREDWPALREAAHRRILEVIEEERQAGRTVLVVPARTALDGPAARELAGVEGVRVGIGFAPHPLFGDWVAEKLAEGRRQLLCDGQGCN